MSKIKSVKYIGEYNTNDLEVEHPDHQYYLANGVLTSNSHSISYSHISFYTAWLRNHYPTEFMCALLNSENPNTDKAQEYINECKNMEIEISPPDINYSEGKYKIIGDKKIVTGITAIKGVGEAAVRNIMENRPYDSLAAFFVKTSGRVVNKTVIESLAKAGAFSSFNRTRKDIYENYSKYVTFANNFIKKIKMKRIKEFQHLLNDLSGEEKKQKEFDIKERVEKEVSDSISKIISMIELPIETVEEWEQKELLLNEQEVLGRTISGSLHDVFSKFFSGTNIATPLDKVDTLQPKAKLRIEAIVKSKIKEFKIKNGKNVGKKFAKYLIEDSFGNSTAMTLWAEDYEKYKGSLIDGTPIKAICYINEYMDQKSLVLYSMERVYKRNGVIK